MCLECSSLIKAIDRYIIKADENLKQRLAEEGYENTDRIVDMAAGMEDGIADALNAELLMMTELIEKYFNCADAATVDKIMELAYESNIVLDDLQNLFKEKLEGYISKTVKEHIREIDNELTLDAITKRTSGWIKSWSEELGQLMKLDSHNELEDILVDALDNGKSVQKTVRGLKDAYSFSEMRARQTAITELLTAYSVSSQEAMDQSPAVGEKEWRHTGSHKNKPRPHHEALDGTIIGKDEKYTIVSPKGTYQALYPRDVSLPAAERVNCHCISRPIASSEVLHMPLEERKQMQQAAIDSIDASWEKGLNEGNKAKAGIDGDKVQLDFAKGKTKTGQIQYMGGKKKWALLESGVINDDKMLQKVRGKTLNELEEDGILTVKAAAFNHSVKGEFTLAIKQYPNGRMRVGGHGESNIKELESRGIEYRIDKVYTNGIRVGGVAAHRNKRKCIGGSGQLWFPQDWSDDDILCAGTFVANSDSELLEGYHKTATYKGVAIRVLLKEEDGHQVIETICPDEDQLVYVKGVKIRDD